ncbi:hypothetical protein, partial [Roseiflexus sp.]
VYNNPLKYVDPDGHAVFIPLLIVGGVIALKALDYGWTAWDAYQATRTLADPHASAADKKAAASSLALTAACEAAEPDDLLPVALPLDDLVRAGIIGSVKRVGDEAAGAVGRTVARDGDPTDEVRDAYAIATRGGKHAGLLQTYAGRSEKEIRKAIRSFERVADLHRRKLANPEQYAEQWEHMSPERRERLLVYWRREVAVYTEQADVLRGLLDHMQH